MIQYTVHAKQSFLLLGAASTLSSLIDDLLFFKIDCWSKILITRLHHSDTPQHPCCACFNPSTIALSGAAPPPPSPLRLLHDDHMYATAVAQLSCEPAIRTGVHWSSLDGGIGWVKSVAVHTAMVSLDSAVQRFIESA